MTDKTRIQQLAGLWVSAVSSRDLCEVCTVYRVLDFRLYVERRGCGVACCSCDSGRVSRFLKIRQVFCVSLADVLRANVERGSEYDLPCPFT